MHPVHLNINVTVQPSIISCVNSASRMRPPTYIQSWRCVVRDAPQAIATADTRLPCRPAALPALLQGRTSPSPFTLPHVSFATYPAAVRRKVLWSMAVMMLWHRVVVG